jgi:hypothetical protein
MGGNHTFSMSLEGTGVNKEIGSGITIMGYAGITSQDVAPHSIDIYHEATIAQIQSNLTTKTCPITTSLAGNNATPVVAAVGNYIIPKSTPFALTGSATDADGDPITYCWEQNDNSTASGAGSVASATKTNGPNWLSFSPTTSPTRICPKLDRILAGQLFTGPITGGDAGANIEYLSSVARTLNFRLTVRDNCPYSSTAPIKVELYSPQASSTVNHWGTSVIIDGGQTPDTSYVFSAGMSTILTNQAGNVRSALISIRLAPSSDSGTTGILGVREIITRMQVLPAQVDAFTTGNTSFRMDLVLNGVPSGGTFVPTGGSSLTQLALHAANTTIFGGETIYSFFTSPNSATSQPLTAIRDVGTSILSGGNTYNVPTSPTNLYPDGPDILTICATPLSGTNSVNARFSWTENQA